MFLSIVTALSLAFCCLFASLLNHHILKIPLRFTYQRKFRPGPDFQHTLHLARNHPVFGIGLLVKSYLEIRRKEYLKASQERFFRYGNTYKTNMMGTNAILTIDPENIRTILALNISDYSVGARRANAFVPYLGHGIISVDGDTWMKSRQLFRAKCGLHQSDLMTMEKHILNLLDAIPRDRSMVDLQQLFFHLTIDIVSEFFCGQSTQCLSPEQRNSSSVKFADAFGQFQCAIRDRMCLGRLATLAPAWTASKDRDCVYKYVDDFIQKVLAVQTSCHSGHTALDRTMGTLNVLSRKSRRPSDHAVGLREDVLHMFLGARDTTGSLLSNLWFVLARRPDVWAKLRDEIDVLGGERPSLDQLKGLNYLRWCIKECMGGLRAREPTACLIVYSSPPPSAYPL